MTDTVIQHIEEFRCPRGALFAERRNRGYTLYDAQSGAPVARLRQIGADGMFEVLYWSLWKERWASTGPFGRTILPIDDALKFIAYEDIFWVMTRTSEPENAESRAEIHQKIEFSEGSAARKVKSLPFQKQTMDDLRGGTKPQGERPWDEICTSSGCIVGLK